MMTLATFCNKALLFVLMMLGAIVPAMAHSIIQTPNKSHENQSIAHKGLHSKASPDDGKYHVGNLNQLITDYSLTGNDALIPVAWRLLTPKLQGKASPDSLLQAAWLAQAEHKFTQARKYLQRVLQIQPRNGQAWLLEASIALVSGDKMAARHACRQLVLTVSPVAAISCNARLSESQKEKTSAYAKLKSLSSITLKPRLHAWVIATLASLAYDLHYWQEAAALNQQAVNIFPSIQNRATLMDVFIQQQRYADILKHVSEDETTPALAVRRLFARKALGLPIQSAVQAMDKRFHHWIADKDFLHAREMAFFYLSIFDDPKQAYWLASENLKNQREKEDMALFEAAKLAIGKRSVH
jgi:tetratricopeptide (TPR) repeat protein